MQTLIDKCVRGIFDAGFSQEVKLWAASKGKIKAVTYYDGISYSAEGDTVEEAVVAVTAKLREKVAGEIAKKADEMGAIASRAARLKVCA